MGKYRTVDEYIANVEPALRPVVRELRDVVREAVPAATETVKWSQPTYEDNGPFCYIKAFKNHVNLGFWRGKSLNDPQGLVQSGGDVMGHIRFTSASDIVSRSLVPLIRQAMQLNRELGDPTARR